MPSALNAASDSNSFDISETDVFIPNAHKEFHRLWSIRVALFFGLLNGFVIGLAAFIDVFNPWLFMGLNIFGYVLLAVVRMVRQEPGEWNNEP